MTSYADFKPFLRRLRCRFEVTSMPAPYTDTHDSGPKSPKHDAKIDPLESLRKILEEKIIEDLQTKVEALYLF